MKLESFKDKKVTRRKMVLISLGVIIVVGISLLLYKTYVQFRGEVDLDNDNVLFGFYNGNTRLDEMPQKNNPNNLVFERAECDNGATVEWNEDEWAPLVKGLTKKKTKCTLYFGEKKLTGVELLEQKVQEEQTKENPELMYDETEDRNLRYVGANPNNYIKIANNKYDHDEYAFRSNNVSGQMIYNSLEECESNSEYLIQEGYGTCELLHKQGEPILWRIIGVMKNVYNVETNKKEDLIKIIREASIGLYTWDTSASGVNGGSGVNEWSQADLMKLLNPGYSDNRDSICVERGEYGVCISYSENQLVNNSLYWNNKSGQCYSGPYYIAESCDFTNSGISEEARKKIAKVRWNTGTFATYDSSEWTASATYMAERSEINGKNCTNDKYNNCNDEVERTTIWDGYIGLINPSDYGYAVGKNVRNACLTKSMYNYNEYGCSEPNWLTMGNYDIEWAINPAPNSYSAEMIFNIDGSGFMDASMGTASNTNTVHPVVYLKSNVTISDGTGTHEDPFIAS